jgi:comEA protein
MDALSSVCADTEKRGPFTNQIKAIERNQHGHGPMKSKIRYLKKEEHMKKSMLPVLALLAIFALVAAGPASAKDEKAASEAQKSLMQTAETATIEKININKADLETLTHIKGLGKETAQNIINHRTEVGAFQNIDDLKHVKGLGEKTLEQIRPYIRLD